MSHINGWSQLLGDGKHVPAPQTDGSAEGTIHTVSAETQTATVQLPEAYGPNAFFGPIPYSSSATPPAPGNKCLVIFVGSGIDRGWIVGWSAQS